MDVLPKDVAGGPQLHRVHFFIRKDVTVSQVNQGKSNTKLPLEESRAGGKALSMLRSLIPVTNTCQPTHQ